MGPYFSDAFVVTQESLSDYGAFNISLVSDLPLFIDPFLLFNSTDPKYQALHESIIRYLTFLRDKAVSGTVDDGLLKSWYYFKEVKQNWLGFTFLGNGGRALGRDFATSLHTNLALLFSDVVGAAKGRHLEKLALIRGGVGRDSISDFTTNLIKDYLLEYTQRFALTNIDARLLATRRVRRVTFNYATESWQDGVFTLQIYHGDFVLLTPANILTRDETWINRTDLLRGFDQLPDALSDDALRSQVSNYFRQRLSRRPTQAERDAAAQATIEKFPVLLDYYIAERESEGDRATAVSADRVRNAKTLFVNELRSLIADLATRTEIYKQPHTSLEEARHRVRMFKHYVESQDGYRLINRPGSVFSDEKEVQLFFGLAMVGSAYDVNREPNNGRGPVDVTVSMGAYDKSLVEFKLGSNSQLRRNLQNQVAVYEDANQTTKSIKAIVVFDYRQEVRVGRILSELKLTGHDDVIVIDARADNKPTGSKA